MSRSLDKKQHDNKKPIHLSKVLIDSVQFYVAGTDDIKSRSALDISSRAVNKSSDSSNIHSLFLGSVEAGVRCNTCFLKNSECVGHSGHAPLKYPLQSPLFRDKIMEWLDCVCHNCGSLLPFLGSTKSKSTKLSKICATCGYVNPKLTRDEGAPVKIIASTVDLKTGKTVAKYLYNHIIYKIFEKITPETVEKKGYRRTLVPKDYILWAIYIPSNNTRPADTMPVRGKSMTCDITVLLKQIIDINNTLPSELTKQDVISAADELNCINMDILYSNVILSSSAGTIHINLAGGKKPKSVGDLSKSKGGAWRRNVHGKRVRLYCRDVISGNPRLKDNEACIPTFITKQLHYPVVVNRFNIEELTLKYIRGSSSITGAVQIATEGKNLFNLDIFKQRNPTYKLSIGDVLHIPVDDKSSIILNRNPSLLNTSMTAFDVKKWGHHTISISDGVCSLYNADFDGDNMNGHIVPYSYNINEQNILYGTASRFISGKDGKPQLGLQQDAIIALSQISTNPVKISKETALKIMPVPLAEIKPYYTGCELLSMIIPKGINLKKKASFYNSSIEKYITIPEDEINISIKDGVFEHGIIDKTVVGVGARNGLFDLINIEYGPHKVIDVIHALKLCGLEWIDYEGFSLGLGDFMLSEEALENIAREKNAILESAERLTDSFLKGDLITPLNMTTSQYYEELMIKQLNVVTDSMIKATLLGFKSYRHNPFNMMINISNKGSIKNTLSIMSCIGQILVDGLRISPTFGHNRTDLTFRRYDLSPQAYGFCGNSFMTGMDYENILPAAADARDAMKKRQLSTAITGESNRSTSKNLESLVVNNTHQTVRSQGLVVQQLYGGYGFNMTLTSKFNLANFVLSNAEFKKQYLSTIDLFDIKFRNEGVTTLLEGEFKQLLLDRSYIRRIKLETEERYEKAAMFNTEINIPFNINKIMNDIVIKQKDEIKSINSFNPTIMITKVNEFVERFMYLFTNKMQYEQKKRIPEKFIMALKYSTITIRYCLCSRRLLEHKITTESLDYIFAQIFNNARKCIIDPGSLVGILASQSFGEPFTQYLLDATRSAGSSKTDRITRSKELAKVSATSEMSQSSMILYLNEEYESDKSKAYDVARLISTLKFESLLNETGNCIIFESFGKIKNNAFKSDEKWMKEFTKRHSYMLPPSDLFQYLFRFEVKSSELIFNFINIDEIITALYKIMNDNIYVMYSSEFNEIIIIRIYIKQSLFQNVNNIESVIKIFGDIKTCKIRGITGITSASVNSVIRHYEDKDGSIQNRTIYAISTLGSNLKAIMDLPWFDINKCQSDSVVEMLECFGLLTALQKLTDEFKETQPNIVPSHYTLFADEMVSTGVITSLSDSGLSKRIHDDVLLRVAYKDPMQVLKDACVTGSKNIIESMSSAIAIGRCPEIGSTYNSIVVDFDKIEKLTATK